MKIVLDYRNGTAADDSEVIDEVRRIADMLEQGYTCGELVAGNGGWWHTEED